MSFSGALLFLTHTQPPPPPPSLTRLHDVLDLCVELPDEVDGVERGRHPVDGPDLAHLAEAFALVADVLAQLAQQLLALHHQLALD